MATIKMIPRPSRDDCKPVDDDYLPTHSHNLLEDGVETIHCRVAAGEATDQAQSECEDAQSESDAQSECEDAQSESDAQSECEDRDEDTSDLKFTWCDMLCCIVGIVSYILDVGSDIWVAYMYYKISHWWWFGLTTTFVIVPAFITTMLNLNFYIIQYKEDKDDDMEKSYLWWASRFIFLFLQLGPVMRYIDTMIYGWKSNKSIVADDDKNDWYDKMIHEVAGNAFLRLLESFMEAAPQLILQLYVMTKLGTLSGTVILTGQSISAVTSLASLAWSLTAFQKALRRDDPDKANMKYSGMAVHFLWRYFTIGARILAIAMFASSYQVWVLLIVGGHWLMMFIWIFIIKVAVSSESKIGSICVIAVLALVYIFCYFKIHFDHAESDARLKYFFFYIVTYAENAVMIFMWYFSTKSEDLWYHIPAVVFVMGGFFVGIFFQLLYYLKFHPSKTWVSFRELCSW